MSSADVLTRDVWAALRSSTDWRAAFASTVGVSVDQFYADFEAYQATL